MKISNTDLIYAGMFAAFLQDGLNVESFDKMKNIIYISLPEDSYAYHITDHVTCAEEYAKNIKEKLFYELLGTTVRVKMKIRKGEYWTKEMGTKNYKKNIGTVVDTFNV